jgi:hypothetical protein
MGQHLSLHKARLGIVRTHDAAGGQQFQGTRMLALYVRLKRPVEPHVCQSLHTHEQAQIGAAPTTLLLGYIFCFTCWTSVHSTSFPTWELLSPQMIQMLL